MRRFAVSLAAGRGYGKGDRMNLQAVIVANSFGAGLMVMLLVCAGKNIRRYDVSEKIFYSLIWATICLCVLETASFCIDGQSFAGARAINIGLNFLLYTTNIVFVFLWTVYTDYKLYGDMARIRRRSAVLVLPALCVLAMLLVNLFQPVVFSVSADNVYARTRLALVPYGVSFFYLAYGEVLIYRNSNNAKRYLFVPSVIFILPIVIGSVVQLLFYGLSVTWAALSVSMVSIYLNVQGEFSAVDPLSGVRTRQYMDDYLHRKGDGKHALTGAMIDLDHFKSINDRFGHRTGDEALRSFGRILRTVADSDDLVARYGGDEFVILRRGSDPAEIEGLIHRLETGVTQFNATSGEPFTLSFSYGLSSYEPKKDTIDGFLEAMDTAMYGAKFKR